MGIRAFAEPFLAAPDRSDLVLLSAIATRHSKAVK
ncbi:hypothetical protein RSal33209_1014 [Renibacterium salmoninarum ATCC 33209]|uniref:Uncharacterized protein n=1 Tax=Renibacterium salmoninarum (strain ATCC 33209 / DSM 20767 / JCM 11484 / NBRC 15589 / NCIMB 2235) TaxID=288705 RepID=A9WNT6_RENSM|nr:hypothetical protein RSal33209_1014 [Renibacterium salmoninarum ATCC 33209]